VPTSVSVSELLVQPDPIDAFDAHDLLLKLTDIPLPLNISYVDPASRISDDGKGIYATFQVIADYQQLVHYYLHEMERHGWRCVAVFESQDPSHSMMMFDKPNGYRACIILFKKSSYVTIKIYRIAPQQNHFVQK